MASSVNKVILLGNLGKDPELRYTGNGTAVANFTLATSDKYKDKEGTLVDRTEWHNIVCWSRTAEIAGQYLKKGEKVYVEGRLQTRSYDDKEGQKKYITEIVVNELTLLGGRRDSDSGMDQSSRSGSDDEFAAPRQQAARPAPARAAEPSGRFDSGARKAAPERASSPLDDTADDLPF